jgi:integrase/recombinase XerD
MNSKERAYFIAKSKVKKANEKATPINRYYENFTAYLQAQNLREIYIERHISQVERYKKWLYNRKDKLPENAEQKDILAFLQYLQEQNLATNTRQQLLGILRHYYNFLHGREEINSNPTQWIKLRGAKKKLLKKILTIEEMDELLDVHYQLKVRHAKQGKTDSLGRFQSRKHIHQRNNLILSLCIYQGLKRAEILSLTLDDIDLQKAVIKVQEQHKSNARTLSLKAVQIGIFYEYLEHSRPLFNNENGLLINSQPELQKMMKTLRKLYPKFTELLQLRSSVITYWIQTEGLRKAQYKAGHRYISSTEEYLAGDLESLKEDINRFHPL